MQSLFDEAATVGALLKARGETIAVAEGAAGGLVCAALLAAPGASAYFLGGGAIYTRAARSALLGIQDSDLQGFRPATEPYALLLAGRMRDKLGATWGVGETGAAGPTGNRYGDPAGHACIAVAGPVARSLTVATGNADRVANMSAFAAALLALLRDTLETAR